MRVSHSVIAALMAIVVASPALAAPAVRRDKVCPAKDDENSNLKSQVIEGDKLNCQYEAAGGCVYFLGNGNFSSGSSTCPDAGLDAGDPLAGKIVNGKVNIDQGMAEPPMKEEQPMKEEPPMKDEQPMMHEPPMQEPPMQEQKPKEEQPMMHDQPPPPPPMHEPPMQQEKPKETSMMMHEPPMMTSTMMHEPPMMTSTMMHEPPMTTPPPMHEPPMQQEKPKEEPPMTHEPPMQQAPPPPPPPPANKPLEDCLHQCKMAMPESMMMGHMRR